MRCPAWCDRVLWKKTKQCLENLTLHAYECIKSGVISDHKAVAAKFTVTAKQIDWEKRDFTLEQALCSYTNHDTAKAPNVNIPYPLYQLDNLKNDIKIEPSFLSLSVGDKKTISITNKHNTPVLISYINESDLYMNPTWVNFSNIDSETGTLLEIKSSLKISVEINDEAVNALNSSASSINSYTNPALLSLRKYINTEINTILFLRIRDSLISEVYVDVMVPILVRM